MENLFYITENDGTLAKSNTTASLARWCSFDRLFEPG